MRAVSLRPAPSSLVLSLLSDPGWRDMSNYLRTLVREPEKDTWQSLGSPHMSHWFCPWDPLRSLSSPMSYLDRALGPRFCSGLWTGWKRRRCETSDMVSSISIRRRRCPGGLHPGSQKKRHWRRSTVGVPRWTSLRCCSSHVSSIESAFSNSMEMS